jgi:predicted aspartyl protease
MFVAALSVLSLAVQAAPAVTPPSEPVAASEAPAAVNTPLYRDTRGRPTIDARFNGQPPVRMVVDTAAQMSLVSPSLVQELGLPGLGEGMTVSGVAGQTQAELYGVDNFATDLFDVEGVALLAMPNASVTEARGIVGMEMFSQRRLEFDLSASRLTLGPSGQPDGFVAVQGKLNEAGLLIVPVEIDGVAFDALVDTGAGVSVASGGALRALGWSDDDPRLKAAGTIRGATEHQTAIRSGRVGRIKLGPVNFRDIDLVFADTPSSGQAPTASSAPGSEEHPNLILGSDLLNALQTYAIDFSKSQLQIRVPAARGTN